MLYSVFILKKAKGIILASDSTPPGSSVINILLDGNDVVKSALLDTLCGDIIYKSPQGFSVILCKKRK